MARHGKTFVVAAAALLFGVTSSVAQTKPNQVNTIREVGARLSTCWRPPLSSQAHAMDITVIVSFNRAGEILGHPRISYESAGATDSDRVQYRIAVMETLQRCSPMPFTETMAGAVAGHPFAVRFNGPKISPQATERRI